MTFEGGRPGKDKGSMTFSECMVRTPAGCTTPEAGFKLTSTTELIVVKEEILDKFTGNTGDEIKVEGLGCVVAGTYSLAGTFDAKISGETMLFSKELSSELKVLRKFEEEGKAKEEEVAATLEDGSGMELKL